MSYSPATLQAREYYNSEDAENFYSIVWGGQDIHIGLYEEPGISIARASERTVERIADCLPGIDKSTRVLDLGAGYGGAARYLTARHGCSVVCLNLSEAQNERNRQLTAEAGLEARIEIVDGSFEDVPFANDSFDVIWSQDAILHSGNRGQVLAEVARVLRPGGDFVLTDPMQADDCPSGVLAPILERLHLESLASPGYYRRNLASLGFEERDFLNYSQQLPRHYGHVLAYLQNRRSELETKISKSYMEKMMAGLQRWIEGGEAGHLVWGIFHFRRGV